jgi:uncharacterized Zn finger protein
MGPPLVLVQVAVSQGPFFLHRCENCGTLWEENLRGMHIVTQQEAKEHFPQFDS